MHTNVQTDRQTNKLRRLPLNKVHSLILECRGELGEWLQQPSLGKDHQQDTAVSLLQEVQNLWHVFLLAGHFRPFVWLHLHGNIMIYKKCHIRTLYSRVHWPLLQIMIKGQFTMPSLNEGGEERNCKPTELNTSKLPPPPPGQDFFYRPPPGEQRSKIGL